MDRLNEMNSNFYVYYSTLQINYNRYAQSITDYEFTDTVTVPN